MILKQAWSILNDGQGIAVTKHETEKVYNAALIFGHLLTSSNYNKDERRSWVERMDMEPK